MFAQLTRWVAQPLVDVLVEDRCQLCGRSAPDADADRAPTPGAVTSPMLSPTRVRFPGGITIENHPLCAPCAGMLQPWGREKRIGYYQRGGSVTLPGTEAFGTEAVGGERHPFTMTAAYRTTDELLEIIHRVKFSCCASLMPLLADALTRSIDAPALGCRPVLVPVPMDAHSTRARGFNQAELLARGLSLGTGIPMAPRALDKPATTRRQSTLSRGQRVDAVRGAFVAGPDPVRGSDVVIVDDLVTTGATTAACAALTLECGATSVRVACAGYAP